MLIIIIPTIIGQILSIFVFYDRHWYNVSYYTSNIISREVVLLIRNHGSSTSEMQMQDYLNLSYRFYKDQSIQGKQGKISEELEIFRDILKSKINNKILLKLNQEGKIEILVQLQKGYLQILMPAKTLMNPTTYIFVFWLIFLTTLLLLISLVLLKNQIKSILELANAADAFGMGNFKDYKPSGATEIRRAGLAFLKMKDRIEKQIFKRTKMLAMISHDLRTPLTRMSLQLELMDSSEDTVALKEDVVSMKHMIDSYLDFAHGEGGESFVDVSAYILLSEFIKQQFSSAQINLLLEQKLTVSVKPYSLKRALSNLINNAIKYSTKVQISSLKEDKYLSIIIEDDGPGIPIDERQLVFKPFYRSESARPIDQHGNVGLGLAIAQEIIFSHKGKIILGDSKDLGGLMVKVLIPISDQT